MKRLSLSLGMLGMLGMIGMIGMLGCDKKKGPSEEPTQGDADSNADSNASGGSEVIVEQPGEEPSAEGSSIDPRDNGELRYEGTVEAVATSVACEIDADCVPQECCHATTCGPPSARPDCSATMCTMDCRSGTMDCFGGCACGPDKKCVSTIWTASPS